MYQFEEKFVTIIMIITEGKKKVYVISFRNANLLKAIVKKIFVIK